MGSRSRSRGRHPQTYSQKSEIWGNQGKDKPIHKTPHQPGSLYIYYSLHRLVTMTARLVIKLSSHPWSLRGGVNRERGIQFLGMERIKIIPVPAIRDQLLVWSSQSSLPRLFFSSFQCLHSPISRVQRVRFRPWILCPSFTSPHYRFNLITLEDSKVSERRIAHAALRSVERVASSAHLSSLARFFVPPWSLGLAWKFVFIRSDGHLILPWLP